MKAKAADLYFMANYDTLVFIFFLCDITKQLIIVYKQVQEKNLQISDVDRVITFLCTHLTVLDSKMPKKFPLKKLWYIYYESILGSKLLCKYVFILNYINKYQRSTN